VAYMLGEAGVAYMLGEAGVAYMLGEAGVAYMLGEAGVPQGMLEQTHPACSCCYMRLLGAQTC
jgi:hypothetical protein